MTEQEREAKLALVGQHGFKQVNRHHQFVTGADPAEAALHRSMVEAVEERRLKTAGPGETPAPKQAR